MGEIVKAIWDARVGQGHKHGLDVIDVETDIDDI